MKAVLKMNVPDWQIGQEASVYFKDTMMIRARCENAEPVTAELEGGGSNWWYVCGECHGYVDENDRYCRHCGREIKPDD